jgi:transposase
MSIPQKLISEELYNKAQVQLKKMNQYNKSAIKLKAIIAAKESGIKTTAKVFNISINTLRYWAKEFEKDGLTGLKEKEVFSQDGKILQIHKDAIKEWFKNDANLDISKIKAKLEDEFNLLASNLLIKIVLSRMNIVITSDKPASQKEDNTMLEKEEVERL